MTQFTDLSFDILYHLIGYLTAQEFSQLTQCTRSIYQLQWIDIIWKRYCRKDYHLQYTHPDQKFRELYFQCRDKTKRLPCCHLQPVSLDIVAQKDIQFNWKHNNKCEKCFVTGIENLFICVSDQCHKILCDRHARRHSHKTESNHAIFYKPNMSELFCQRCVDWMGGVDANPAEQYYSELITTHWLTTLYSNNKGMQRLILEFKAVRRPERKIRWTDTPQRALSNGYCFIASSWIAEWEMFVEGWVTENPIHIPIDQHILLANATAQISANPFHVTLENNVMIISNETWDYISKAYIVKGGQVTEDHLMASQEFSKSIEFWRERA